MKLSELIKQKILLSDGSMGALLASMGYKDSCPDALSVTRPEVIRGIHRSYLVNLKKIMKFDKSKIELINGKTVEISTRKYKAFCQRYLEMK